MGFSLANNHIFLNLCESDMYIHIHTYVYYIEFLERRFSASL